MNNILKAVDKTSKSNRDLMLGVKVDVDTYDKFEQAARNKGLNKSQALRQVIDLVINSELNKECNK